MPARSSTCKMESHPPEARLWNDVFVMTQNELGLPQGTIKATVLIETIVAAFEMEEILYELRERSAGLNAGRWDCLRASKFKLDKNLPGRPCAGNDDGAFMRAVPCCFLDRHKRGAPAIGGMAR